MLLTVSSQSLNPLPATISYCRTNFHLPTILPRADSSAHFDFSLNLFLISEWKIDARPRQAPKKQNRDELGTRLRVSGCLPRAILGFVSEQNIYHSPFHPGLHSSFHSRSTLSLQRQERTPMSLTLYVCDSMAVFLGTTADMRRIIK